MTANMLVRRLVEDILGENRRLSAYFVLVRNKAEYSDVLKKDGSASLIGDLRGLLDKQHKLLSYYVVEKAPRIRRVIELLEKIDKKFSSKESSKAYKPLLNFLKELIKRGGGKKGCCILLKSRRGI